jgi:hypothetical protein
MCEISKSKNLVSDLSQTIVQLEKHLYKQYKLVTLVKLQRAVGTWSLFNPIDGSDDTKKACISVPFYPNKALGLTFKKIKFDLLGIIHYS